MVALHRIDTYGSMTDVSNRLEAVADEPNTILSSSPADPDRSSVSCSPDVKTGLPNTTTDDKSGSAVSVDEKEPLQERQLSRGAGHTESTRMTKQDNATAKAVSQPVLIYRKPFNGTVTARTHWNSNGCFIADNILCRNLSNRQVTDDLTREIHGAPALAGPVPANGDKRLHNSWGLLLNTSIEKIILLLTLDEFRQCALVAALITIRRWALSILKRAAAAIKQTVVKVAIAGLLTAGVMPVALLPATVPPRSPGQVLRAAADRKENNMLAVHQDVILPASPAPASLPQPVRHHEGVIQTAGMSSLLREIRQNIRYGKADHRAEWLINPERTRLHPVL